MNVRIKTISKASIILFLLFIMSQEILAQTDEDDCSLSFTIPEIALLDIEPSGLSNISLTLTADSESGLPISASGAINDELWINYTSCLATGSNNRSVSVHIANGNIPDGVSLILSPSAFSGSGHGSLGSPAGNITLSYTPQTIISGIGRCYTGDGQNNGHKLSYSLRISDYNSLNYNSSSTIQIAFTLTDN